MLEKSKRLEAEFRDKSKRLESSRKSSLNDLKNQISFQFRSLKPDLTKLEVTFKEATFLNSLFQNELKSFLFLPSQIHLDESLVGEIKQCDVKLITCYTNGSIMMNHLESSGSNLDFFEVKHKSSKGILISADKQKLISGGKDGSIKVWDLKTGIQLKSLSNEDNGKKWGIKCMVNSARSNEIFFGSNHNKIRILDLNTLEIKQFTQNSHSKLIKYLEFLTDDILVSYSADLTIKVWSLNKDKCLQTIDLKPFEPRCLRKISDSKFALGFHEGKIQIFGSDKEGIFSSLKQFSTNLSSHINDFKVSLDLNLLISLSGVIHVWDLDDFTCVRRFSSSCFYYSVLEILPNNRLIVANKDNTLESWCLKTGKSLGIVKTHFPLSNKIKFFY